MKFANYASFPHLSRGRKFNLSSIDTRDCFERDRDRIIHSVAFRKLEYKTQVFTNYEGDYYRTRLTHSLEVSQIARSMARSLNLNEDLTETIALAHDLGHPPFGHTGERALQEVSKDLVVFDHNVQTIRILVDLEKRYYGFNGLNLSWETLEGLAKHNGPVLNPGFLMKQYDLDYAFELNTFASLEAQVASVSDDIAYNAHDLDDGVKSNILSLSQLESLSIFHKIFSDVKKDFNIIDDKLLLKESLRRFITFAINDVILQSKKNIAECCIETVHDVRHASMQLIDFSPEMQNEIHAIRDFLFKNLYMDYRVLRPCNQAKSIVIDLFNIFYSQHNMMPTEWARAIDGKTDVEKSIIICDFIAGMTDRFAVKEHQRLFDVYSLITSHYPH